LGLASQLARAVSSAAWLHRSGLSPCLAWHSHTIDDSVSRPAAGANKQRRLVQTPDCDICVKWAALAVEVQMGDIRLWAVVLVSAAMFSPGDSPAQDAPSDQSKTGSIAFSQIHLNHQPEYRRKASTPRIRSRSYR
jgi:hypothetical protein